ncbi:MAG: hypothetical protein GYA24_08515 [Candidatus Lokiarchaeota archaeon]|nr:hypothetical protein [Candidatus Lokiarchaeota archaeon]
MLMNVTPANTAMMFNIPFASREGVAYAYIPKTPFKSIRILSERFFPRNAATTSTRVECNPII